MNYKKLMRSYLWLLFCSVVLMVLCGYVYIFHYYNYIMLLGFNLSLGSIAELIKLIRRTYENHKNET